jgi:hypothetical protein
MLSGKVVDEQALDSGPQTLRPRRERFGLRAFRELIHQILSPPAAGGQYLPPRFLMRCEGNYLVIFGYQDARDPQHQIHRAQRWSRSENGSQDSVSLVAVQARWVSTQSNCVLGRR